jgi:hypothetical protein
MTRGRGRPPLPPEQRVAAELSLNLTNGDYDALLAIAVAERVPVQAVIRRAISRFLKAQRRGPLTRRSVTIKRTVGL